MAASKKVRLRMGWSGDQFHLEGVRFDELGAWDKDDRPVVFTEADAAEAMKRARANGVILNVIEDEPDSGAASGGSTSGQEG